MLKYNPDTGVFIWVKPPKFHPRMINKEAGCNTTGYCLIRIDNKKYKAHRLAWLYIYGELPKGDLDHINGDCFDNRICNLRQCTNAQNQANKRRMKGKSLPKGVRRNGKKYAARISVNKKQITIGTFDTPEQASKAYFERAIQLYGNFAKES